MKERRLLVHNGCRVMGLKIVDDLIVAVATVVVVVVEVDVFVDDVVL